MTTKRILILIVSILLSRETMFGWGKEGHIIVGEVANRFLSSAARIQIKKYLKDQSLANVANWMDAIRVKQPAIAVFHFINSDKPGTENLQIELNRVIASLMEYEGKNEGEINLDLKYAVHLIGDLHQPLHCGLAADKGGNNVPTSFEGEKLSLHHIWDSDILENQNISVESCYNLYSTLSKEEVNTIEKISVEAWIKESRGYLAWLNKFDHGKPITKAYTEKAGEIITLQLLKAGLRLAAVLNKVFAVESVVSAQPLEKIVSTAAAKAASKRAFNNIRTGEELIYIEYPQYSVGYSEKYKIPIWTYYEMKKTEQLNCVIQRKGSFKQDKSQDVLQADADDYKVKVAGKVYEKGHMVPCESMTFDCDAMYGTFFYTNCVPQTEKLNTGPWHTLETAANDWAIDYGKILVFTGNLINEDSRKVGENKIGVPDSCFKVIVVYTDKKIAGIAFMMPNIQMALDKPLNYVRTIDQIEASTGIDFFAEWNAAEQKKFESSIDTSLWSFAKDRFKTQRQKNCLKYNKEHVGERCVCAVK